MQQPAVTHPVPAAWSWAALTAAIFVPPPAIPALWSDALPSIVTSDCSGESTGHDSSYSSALEPFDSNASEPFDAVAAQRLLERIERENSALATDPRAVRVQHGGLLAAHGTLQTLAVESFAAPPSPDDSLHHDRFCLSLLDEPDLAAAIARFPHLVAARFRCDGIPPSLRPRLWLRLAAARIDELKLIYPSLLSQESSFELIISRDITRTFPGVPLFESPGGDGQRMLQNVLKAYSIYDREVGYCQGLSFCAGIFLIQNLSEQETLAILIRLLEDSPPSPSFPPKNHANSPVPTCNSPSQPHPSPMLPASPNLTMLDDAEHDPPSRDPIRTPQTSCPLYALRSCFLPDMAGLHLALYQHSELLKILAPNIDAHLRNCSVTATMYASQWFLTIFSYNFPLDFVFRLVDVMLLEGAMLTMMRFSIGILILNTPHLLDVTEIESVLEQLKGRQLVMNSGRTSPGLLIKDALDAASTILPSTLEDLKTRYRDEQRELVNEASTAKLARMEELVIDLTRERDLARDSLAAAHRDNARLASINADLRDQIHRTDELHLHMLKDSQVLRARIAQLEQSLAAATSPTNDLAASTLSDSMRSDAESDKTCESVTKSTSTFVVV